MSTHILKTVTILSLITTALYSESIPVRVNLMKPKFRDLSNTEYPVNFKKHANQYRLSSFAQTNHLYGILHYTTHEELTRQNDLLIKQNETTTNRYDYKVEVPELGRLIYINPDTDNPVVLDQVDSDHPSFIWSISKFFDLDQYQGKSLLENLSGLEFKYMTLIGDVFAKIELGPVGDGKTLSQIGALRSTAPIRKMVARNGKFQHLF